MRAICIANPGAGQRRAGAVAFQDLWDEIRGILEQAGFELELVNTGLPSPTAHELAAAAARKGYDAVIVAGGDGTLSTAASALIDTSVVLGILPFGSVMNIANSIPLPLDPLEAAHVIAGKRVRRIDVGEAGASLFFEAAGVGLDADAFGAGRSLERGDLRGALERVRDWFAHRSHRLSLSIDGRGPVRHRALQVLVTNGRYYAFSLPVVPDADIMDGLLDVAVFPRMGRLDLVRFIAALATRVRPHARPVVYRGREIVVDSPDPLSVHADGFVVGHLPMTFRCRHAALAVFA